MNPWTASSALPTSRRFVVLATLLATCALAAVWAPSALAIGGGQIGEAWGTPGTGNGQFFNPGMFGVDNQDGTVYTGDYTGVLSSESTNYRIQQLSASGEFKASAEIKRFPEAKKQIGLRGIAVDHSLGRIYMVEGCRVGATATTFACKELGTRLAARKILVYSTTPEGTKLVPDKTLPSIALPEGTQEMYEPTAIAVDPSNHDILLLAEENAHHIVVQRIGSSGTLGARFTDTTDKLKPAGEPPANSLAVSNAGEAYTITGQAGPGLLHTRAWQLPSSLASLEAVPGFASAAEGEEWSLGHQSQVQPTLGGSQLAISTDGSTLYWKDWETNSEGPEPGELFVHAFSLTKKETAGFWGNGSTRCKITTSSAPLATTTEGNLVVFDTGAETTTPGTKPAYGLRVMTFGASGTGCTEPVAKFTINGKPANEEPNVKPGELISFDASSSALLSGFRREVIWKFGDGSETILKAAGEEPGEEAPLTTTHTYVGGGKFKVKLEIKLRKPPYGNPTAVERSITVGSPAKTLKLSVTKSGSGTGTVTSTPAGINCGGTCSAEFEEGKSVVLSGASGANTKAVVWTGCDSIVGANECKVTMSAAKSVEASFALEQHLLSVTKSGSGTGTVTSTPAGINCGSTCSASFNHGAEVILSATSGANTKAVVWTGCDSIVGSNECKVTMSTAKSVEAAFALEQHLLSVTKSGSGTGTVSSTPAGINCGSTCSASFNHGTEVILSGASGANTKPVSWTGCDSIVGANECKVTMSTAKSVEAAFALEQHTLSVTKSGSGTGTVTSTPSGINCGSTCSASFNHGTEVILSGASGANTKPVSWTGCDSIVGANECKVTMSTAKSVEASFALEQHLLSVTKSGSGTGTVTSTPAGINCGSTCSASFNHGTVVTLTPTAEGGSEFTGWGGSCSGTGACEVTMTAAKSVEATFSPGGPAFSLKVKKTGIGSGPVTSSPAGIDCRSVCAASFGNGTQVVLSATLGPNTKAVSWAGCDSIVGANECKVTMSSSRTVTANFDGITCGGASLTGHGSDAQLAAQQVWGPAFAALCSGTPSVSYQATGGLSDWEGSINTSVGFIGTERPPNATQIASIKSGAGGAEVATIPVAQTAVAIVAHPPTGCEVEAITNANLEAALEGRLTKWDQLEGAEGSCASPITRVVDLGSSGTTVQLKNYLFTLYKKGLFCTTGGTEGKAGWQELGVASWPEGCGAKTLSALTRPGAAGDGEVVSTVNSTSGSIGYAALPVAKAKASGSTAILELQNNGQKKASEASFAGPEAGSAANCGTMTYTVPKLSGGRDIDWSGVFGARPAIGGTGYPLCMLTYDVALHGYALAGFSAGQAATAREYLYGYVVQEAGQTAAAANFYARLPESSQLQHDVLAAARRAAETVR